MPETKPRRRRRPVEKRHKTDLKTGQLAREQREMQAFVEQHKIACFGCKRSREVRWHLTGRQKTGKPWAVCVSCRRKKSP